ncbi:MAG TPA: thioredoxin domain-containing protein [Gemmatimonadaceae bacterium]|nr:thioredoxin domain-containing protein [Gemmatimonadaceae bacterium]
MNIINDLRPRRLLSVDGLLAVACALCIGVTLWNVKALWAHNKKATSKLVANWQTYASVGNRVGANQAPVQIVAFVDYECPFCKRIDPDLRAVQRQNPAQIAIIYRNLPLVNIHHNARVAAMASECAAEQHAFEQFSAALYNESQLVDRHDWVAIAVKARVPAIDSLERCVDQERFRSRLVEDSVAAKALGVVATPTLLINGRLFAGTLTAAEIDREIQLALGRRSFWTRIFGGS